jgi:hypothetical protein
VALTLGEPKAVEATFPAPPASAARHPLDPGALVAVTRARALSDRRTARALAAWALARVDGPAVVHTARVTLEAARLHASLADGDAARTLARQALARLVPDRQAGLGLEAALLLARLERGAAAGVYPWLEAVLARLTGAARAGLLARPEIAEVVGAS